MHTGAEGRASTCGTVEYRSVMASLLLATGEHPTGPPRPHQPSTEPPVGLGKLQPTGTMTREAPRAQFTRSRRRSHAWRRVDGSSAARTSVRAVRHGFSIAHL